MRVVYIFQSLSKLIKADQLLQENNLKVWVIPVPTSYHSVCGMCLEVSEVLAPEVSDLLTNHNIYFEKHLL